MDLQLTDEERAVLTNVRAFVRNEIVPLEHELDPEASELPTEVHDRLTRMTKSMGLYNLGLPEEYEGAGLSTSLHSLIAMELTQHRAGVEAPSYHVFGRPPEVIAAISEFASDYHKEHFLYPLARDEKRSCFAMSEPSGGSDPEGSIQTRAVEDGDYWTISGTKMWVTDAAEADFMLLFARAEAGLTAFLVDMSTAGITVSRKIPTMRHGHAPAEVMLDEVRVSSACVVGHEGRALEILQGRTRTHHSIIRSAECVGVAIKAQELAVEYAKIRNTFGKTLFEHQGIAWMLVDNEHDIRTSAMMVLHAADRADRGLSTAAEAASAKILATEAASRVIDRSMQIHGGMGVSTEMPLERWYREMRIRRIGGAPSEVGRRTVARELRERPYRSFLG